jgi:hypothetical protein
LESIKAASKTQTFGVSMKTLFRIADALEVPVSKLLEE